MVKLAKAAFLVAGISGLLTLLPMYFVEQRMGRDLPPPITHPEFYYGFIGVGVAFQLVFLLISSDPVRYRPLILAAMVEKFSYGLAVLILAAQNRIAGPPFGFGIVDLAWGIVFTVVFFSGGSAARL
jgi:hypothetical protein